MDITTLGEILIDFTYEGLNSNGIQMFAQNPGGAPANVAAAAAKLGSSSAFIGKAGDDMHGKYLKDTLDQAGVNTEGMVLDSDVFTTLAFVSHDENGERSFSFSRKPGADTCLRFEEIDPSLLENTRIFHVGSLSLTHEPARTATLQALKAAKQSGAAISYDPNYRDSLWPDQQTAIEAMRSLIPYADLMKISDEETALLTDKQDPAQAAQTLVDQGLKAAVVTLGADGALVCTPQGSVHVPGFKCNVVDTNGAGDCFWAGFLHSVASSDKGIDEMNLDDFAKAAKFGNASASLCTQSKGAIPAMPSLEDVLVKLKENQ